MVLHFFLWVVVPVPFLFGGIKVKKGQKARKRKRARGKRAKGQGGKGCAGEGCRVKSEGQSVKVKVGTGGEGKGS